MKERKPYFFLYADDFLSGVLGMSDAHVGVYMKLLCLCWSKDGVSDMEAQGVSRDDDAIQAVLTAKFYQDGDKWRNQKMEKVRRYVETQSECGKRGGAPKGNKNAAKNNRKTTEHTSEKQANIQPENNPHIHIQNHIQSTKDQSQNQSQEDESNKLLSCDEAEEPLASPPLMLFPVKGPKGAAKEWGITKDRAAEYKSLYPTVNVAAECRKARQWLIDNPSRRKTAQGMARFLTAWMCRSSDRLSKQSERDSVLAANNAHKPKELDANAARYALVKTFGVKEARDWPDEEVKTKYLKAIAGAST